MKVLVIYDDGSREFVYGSTWVAVIKEVACHAISLTVVADVDFSPADVPDEHSEYPIAKG